MLKPALAIGKRLIGEYMQKHGIPGFEKYLSAAELLTNFRKKIIAKTMATFGSIREGCLDMMTKKNIRPGVAWGNADSEDMSAWSELECDDKIGPVSRAAAASHDADLWKTLEAKYGVGTGKVCIGMKGEFGVLPGKTWGKLVPKYQELWRQKTCDNFT